MTRKGVIQKKILLLLLAGVALSCTRSNRKHLRIIKGVRNEWNKINDRALKSAIKSLYLSKLISQKKVREALRYHLKNLGFKELHRSVFVFPYECRNEIEYIVEFYNARRFIRYIEAYYIDNELDLKHKFDLL